MGCCHYSIYDIYITYVPIPRPSETTYRVVGFEVVALSRKHSVDATSPISPSPLNPAGIDLKTCLMSRDTVSVFGMYSEQKQGLR